VWSLWEISIINCAEGEETSVVAAGDINYQVRGGRRDMCGRCKDINYQVIETEETEVVVVA
jgi:hypothetical protein